jgi:hypothetical protein
MRVDFTFVLLESWLEAVDLEARQELRLHSGVNS